MSNSDKKVYCDEHGTTPATFVCQHLTRGSGLGFFVADDDDDPFPDAWCGMCDQMLAREGGQWTDAAEAFAKVSLLCADCYVASRRRNEAAESIPFFGLITIFRAGEVWMAVMGVHADEHLPGVSFDAQAADAASACALIEEAAQAHPGARLFLQVVIDEARRALPPAPSVVADAPDGTLPATFSMKLHRERSDPSRWRAAFDLPHELIAIDDNPKLAVASLLAAASVDAAHAGAIQALRAFAHTAAPN